MTPPIKVAFDSLRVLPIIPAELTEQCPSGPMNAKATLAAPKAFKKALFSLALEGALCNERGLAPASE